jgi:pimeloyl-ACP methyl ester carboxylesterase
MPRSRWVTALLASVLCAAPVCSQERAAAAPGVVFVVGGIGGLDPLLPSARYTLPLANVRHEIREFDWTHGKCRLLRDLQDTRYLLARADELAEAVREVKAADPGRPVYLLGHSAGAGLVLAAAERLPPETLERVVLLAPAVSPQFNLCDALRATRGEIVSFNSCMDLVMLKWGTSQFGTVDRVYGPSAGLVGFEVPADLDAEGRQLYQRLVQKAWKVEDLLEFRGGLHHSPCMPIFLAQQVAPWLR